MNTRFSSFLGGTLLILLGSLLLPLKSQAQDEVYYGDVPEGETSVCAFASIGLHEAPGRSSRRLGVIVFAEELEHLGRDAFVRGENSGYLQVRTRDGKTGWANERYLVKNGGVVVLLERSRVYKRPGTYSSATNNYFEAGTIGILSDFQDNWVKLTSEHKDVIGWVEGYDKLSVDERDIEIASMYAQALKVEGKTEKRAALQKIGRTPGFLQSELAPVVKLAIEGTHNTRDQGTPNLTPGEKYLVPYYPDGEDDVPGNEPGPSRGAPDERIADPATPPATSAPVYNIAEREVIDMETGRSYLRIFETGTIQPVKARKPKNIYYAYHKTLPIGSKVLLAIPGDRGFVPLEIVARLKPGNDHVIGLGGEVIKAVFGEVAAKDVPSVTISYPKP
ncbi:MAG: hypothetical protein AAFV07_16620 [Bacteroidota bacterium]